MMGCVVIGKRLLILRQRQSSMTPRSLPAVAKVLSTVTLEQAKDLAAKALAARTSEDAVSLVRANLPILGELGL